MLVSSVVVLLPHATTPLDAVDRTNYSCLAIAIDCYW